jgi:hypothetical protein
MIKFQPLNAAQFDDYRRYFIADYGQEISLNFRVPLAQALVQAETALAESFPAGKAQPGHHLLSIEIDGDTKQNRSAQQIGYFWLTDTEKLIPYLLMTSLSSRSCAIKVWVERLLTP